MKIIVASTPKTGNTWMTHLLSFVYGLPEVELPPSFDATIASQRGSDWVALQHYYPDSDLLAWSEGRQVAFVTMVRHPGDLLVSLWHMLRNRSYDPDSDLGCSTTLLLDGEQMGVHAEQYVKEDFFHGLHISLDWMKLGRSHIVRYEDLWRDPVRTLTDLTNRIQPVEQDRIESAIDLCDLNLLRQLYDDPQGKFFRKGGPGSWRDELPDSIAEIFRHQEPYPSLFQALGYTLNPHDPLIDAPPKPRVSTNPFLKSRRFDNGIEVPAIAVRLYLLLDSGVRARWSGSETATSEHSFFAWLNAPADEAQCQRKQVPMVTNLAHHIYRTRSDLQRSFPDVFHEDRIGYIAWFISNAQNEYDLDQAFIRPLLEGLFAWCDRPTREDPLRPDAEPPITNLALHVYKVRPDLQAAFPDLFGEDRLRFARWFVDHASKSYASSEALAQAVRSSGRAISCALPDSSSGAPVLASSVLPLGRVESAILSLREIKRTNAEKAWKAKFERLCTILDRCHLGSLIGWLADRVCQNIKGGQST